jgi:hypothetical protein
MMLHTSLSTAKGVGSNCPFIPEEGFLITNHLLFYTMDMSHIYRLLEPRELQLLFQEILDSDLKPAPGEEKLAALTAGEREHWAIVRRKYFGSGLNKTSLQAIERAAFVMILDDEAVCYDPVH